MITEIWLGVPIREAAQQRMLDEGYELRPHGRGAHHRTRGVMAIKAPEKPKPKPACRIVACQRAAAELFGTNVASINGRRTHDAICRVRFAAIWAAEKFGFSLSQIGRKFDRDHTTVMNAIRRCEELQHRDMGYRRTCNRLLEMVRDD